MSERDNEIDEKKTALPPAGDAAADKVTPAAGREEEDLEDEVNEEGAYGFDPEQRRFLWTITAVLILGMLASTGINIFYSERQRARQTALVRAQDEVNQAQQAIQLAQEQGIPALAQAMSQTPPNVEAIDQLRSRIVAVVMAEQEKRAALRREQGLEEQAGGPTEEQVGKGIDAAAQRYLSQMRRAGTTRPASGPAATEPSAGPPAPASPGMPPTPAAPPTQPIGPAAP